MKKVNNNYIYTPVSLWDDFVLDCSFNENFISELVNDGIVYKNLYFSANSVEAERVRVFATYACPVNDNGTTIVIVGDPSEAINLDTITLFAKMGYCVLMPDLKGFTEQENFTKYPSNISFANYSIAKEQLFNVRQTAKQTCWYEWASVVRYCIAFCSSNLKAKKLGLVGIKNGSNVCYMSCTEEVDCFVSLFGAGWQMFKDEDKFTEIQNLTDEQRKFIAGIEAESYAQYITCPVLFLSTTNNAEFDFERSVDTLARFPNEPYCDFTPKMRYYLDSFSLNTCKEFLGKYLGSTNFEMYRSPEVILQNKDKFINVNVKYDKLEDIEFCELYYSDASVDVYKRNWTIFSNELKELYTIDCKSLSDYVSVFVRVKYKNGLCLSSPVVVKKINAGVKKINNPLFSGKAKENSFACLLPQEISAGLFFNQDETGVHIVKGPFNINGVSCRSGLISYIIGEINTMITSSNMIKFDIFTKNYNELTVTLLSDEGEIKRYKMSCELKGAKIWQNVCENMSEFIDENGKSIKDFSKVYAITFDSEEEFLLTNLLVV